MTYVISFLIGVVGMIAILSCTTPVGALGTLVLSAFATALYAVDRSAPGLTKVTMTRTFISIAGYLAGGTIVVAFLPYFANIG